MKIALTAGDPYGVGPELLGLIYRKKLLDPQVEFKYYLPPAVAEYYELPADQVEAFQKNTFNWDPSRRGQVHAEAGQISVSYFKQAVSDALDKKVDAIVTGPINKQSVALTSEKAIGHTEILKQMTNSPTVVMGFFGEVLKVFLYTIHVPLKKVSMLLDPQTFEDKIRIILKGLKAYGLKNPRLGVCGLNPHAGEDGLMGDEEKIIMQPVLEKLQNQGHLVSLPLPADTLFYRAKQGEFDAVLAMYHDQGLAPLKLVDFDQAVNVTLGTSIIRTSVDHGTAFDIVGKGTANPASFLKAIQVAKIFVENKASKNTHG